MYKGKETVCSSTEELLAEVGRVNNERIGERDIVGSMDVEALYSSLDIDFTIEKVYEQLDNSRMNIEGINYKELGLYLSLVRTDDELRRDGLDEVCPKRRHQRGPRITGNGTQKNDENRHAPWIFPDVSSINSTRKRKMLVEAMRTVLKVLMETLTYEFANAIRRQRRGGAIGMELTGFVAQIFMV